MITISSKRTAGPPPDPSYVFSEFNDAVSSISFVELNGKHFLLTGDLSGEIILWNLDTRKSIWKYRETKALTQPSIQACGVWSRGIWTHARGQSVRFWTIDNESKEPIEMASIPCAHVGFCGASVLPVDSIDLVAIPTDRSDGYSVKIFELSETNVSLSTELNLRSESGSPMTCLLTLLENTKDVDGGSIFALIGFESGTVELWQIERRSAGDSRMMAEKKLVRESILAMDFSMERRFGVCVSPEKTIDAWRLVQDDEDGQFRIESIGSPISMPTAGAGAVSIRDDARIFAAGGWDGRIRVFACKTSKPLAILQFHQETIKCLAFSRGKVNGRRLLAAGSKDRSLSLWSLYND